jgi:hypothetical protein
LLYGRIYPIIFPVSSRNHSWLFSFSLSHTSK